MTDQPQAIFLDQVMSGMQISDPLKAEQRVATVGQARVLDGAIVLLGWYDDDGAPFILRAPHATPPVLLHGTAGLLPGKPAGEKQPD